MPFKEVTVHKFVSNDADKPTFILDDGQFTIKSGDITMTLSREEAISLSRFIERHLVANAFRSILPSNKTLSSCYALEC